MVSQAISGYNSTILAYGQTGSGKTFTMYGPDILNNDQKGIIPRVSNDVFTYINSSRNQANFQVKVQMLEIYKE